MANLPKKLKKDSIAEALAELRFASAESQSLPELVVARLTEFEGWSGFRKSRLPSADIPAAIRRQDPMLTYQPVLQMSAADGARSANIGSNVVSYHFLNVYPGWEVFQPELHKMIDFLFAKIDGFRVTRIGFRYVNLLNEKDHLINGVQDLNYEVRVGSETLNVPQNLNYRKSFGPLHEVMVRIASPEFAAGPRVGTFSALIDLDVSTLSNFTSSDANEVKKWISDAHDCEKSEFFRLIPEDKLKQLIIE